jgi:hypothetical protein
METVWVSCGVDAEQWTMTIAAALAVVLAGYYQRVVPKHDHSKQVQK